ncbi:hypothetical protein D6825_03715, partial [Candidatus Woesearchaeota archaeon]
LINSASSVKKKKVDEKIIDFYGRLYQNLRDFYDTFYKFDAQKVSHLGNERKKFITEWYTCVKEAKGCDDFLFLHHALVIMQKTFSSLGPLLILNSSSEKPAL